MHSLCICSPSPNHPFFHALEPSVRGEGSSREELKAKGRGLSACPKLEQGWESSLEALNLPLLLCPTRQKTGSSLWGC